MATVYLAIVTHEAGIDVLYAGNSAIKAEAAVAKWCREYWHDEEVDFDTGISDPTTLSDAKVRKLYFQSETVIMNGEQSQITEVEVQDD
jgi:hypothetical protein